MCAMQSDSCNMNIFICEVKITLDELCSQLSNIFKTESERKLNTTYTKKCQFDVGWDLSGQGG